jgi:hypothetical protein
MSHTVLYNLKWLKGASNAGHISMHECDGTDTQYSVDRTDIDNLSSACGQQQSCIAYAVVHAVSRGECRFVGIVVHRDCILHSL